MNREAFLKSREHPLLIVALTIVVAMVIAVATAGPGTGQQTAHQPSSPAQFIAMMNEYLVLGERWVSMAGDTDSAAYLAIEGIVEIYEKRGAKAEAIGHLRRLLDDAGTTQPVRTMIRFKLRDLYNETGQGDKALAELDRILASR